PARRRRPHTAGLDRRDRRRGLEVVLMRRHCRACAARMAGAALALAALVGGCGPDLTVGSDVPARAPQSSSTSPRYLRNVLGSPLVFSAVLPRCPPVCASAHAA